MPSSHFLGYNVFETQRSSSRASRLPMLGVSKNSRPTGMSRCTPSVSFVTKRSRNCPACNTGVLHPNSMTKTKVWKFLSRRFLRESSSGRDLTKCPVAAKHHGPLIAVAGGGSATLMMCTHHAMAWTESDSCRNESWRGALPFGPSQCQLEPDHGNRVPQSEPCLESSAVFWCL
jgi:hypothetical protein